MSKSINQYEFDRDETDVQTFLYFIVCEFKEHKFIKIGKSKNLYNRIHNIRTGCPHEVTHIFTIKSEFEEEIIGLEKLIHRLLVDSNLRGEWYLYTESFVKDITYIMELINSSEILNIDYEFLEVVSFEEVEILLHSHEFCFSNIKLPLGKNLNYKEQNITASEMMKLIGS